MIDENLRKKKWLSRYRELVEQANDLQAKLSAEEFSGFCKGNAIKYLSRAGKKTLDPREDYKKARWYLDKLIEVTDELV